MLDSTLDLIVKYTVLKTYINQIDKNDKIVNSALEVLIKKIQSDLDGDKERQINIEKNEKRIRAKRIKNEV